MSFRLVALCVAAPLFGACSINNGNNEDPGDPGVTLELTPSTLTVRPGKTATLRAFVRGSTTWHTATCTVTMGTCNLTVVQPQEFVVGYRAPGVHGVATLTFAHDGAGGRPGSKPKALSATATISIEGRVTAPLIHDWQASSHAGRISDAVFSSDGSRVASAGLDDRTIKIDDWASGKNLASLTVFSAPTSVEFVPGAPLVLAGTDEHLVRLKDGKGEETGRVKPELPDAAPDNNQPRSVQDIACHETTKKCALVRGPASPECKGCIAGLFVVDEPAAEALAVRRLALGAVGQKWTRVAWSPDGTRLAVLEGQSIRIFEAATGAAFARISDVFTGLEVESLAWPEADRIVTTQGTYSVQGGQKVGAGGGAATGSASWRGGERLALGDRLTGGPFTFVQGNTSRKGLGPNGTFTDYAAARDAGYVTFAIEGANGSGQDNGLWVYAKETGAEVARIPARIGAARAFDMCTTGELVYAGDDGRLRLATPGGYTPVLLEIAGETLTWPVYAIPDPILDRTSRTAGCHMLVGAGQNKSLIVNVNERRVARTLPFGAAAQSNTFGDRFLILNTVFGAKARVLDEQGNLVFEIPDDVKHWSTGSGSPSGLDAQGMFHTWQWGNDCAARPCSTLVHADPYQLVPPTAVASFNLPRGGPAAFILGFDLALRSQLATANTRIRLEHGGALPFVVYADPSGGGRYLIAGANFILSYPARPITDRLLDAMEP